MSHRLHHRFYDPEFEKVVPRDAIVLDVSALDADAYIQTLRTAAITQVAHRGRVLRRLAEQIEAAES